MTYSACMICQMEGQKCSFAPPRFCQEGRPPPPESAAPALEGRPDMSDSAPTYQPACIGYWCRYWCMSDQSNDLRKFAFCTLHVYNFILCSSLLTTVARIASAAQCGLTPIAPPSYLCCLVQWPSTGEMAPFSQ